MHSVNVDKVVHEHLGLFVAVKVNLFGFAKSVGLRTNELYHLAHARAGLSNFQFTAFDFGHVKNVVQKAYHVF